MFGSGGKFLLFEEWDFSLDPPEFHLLTKFHFGFKPYVWYIEGGNIALMAFHALVLLTCFCKTWDREYGFYAGNLAFSFEAYLGLS